MADAMLRVLGWRLLLFDSDLLVLDRWFWVRRRLKKGLLRTFDAGCGNRVLSIYAARCGNRVLAASFSSDEDGALTRISRYPQLCVALRAVASPTSAN
jgi:hypothetical protein